MDSIIKLSPKGRLCTYLGIPGPALESITVGPDYAAAYLPLAPTPDMAIRANGRVELRLPFPLMVKKVVAMVEVHPLLLSSAMCSFPHSLTSGEGGDFKVIVNAFKAIDLNAIPWLVRIVVLD